MSNIAQTEHYDCSILWSDTPFEYVTLMRSGKRPTVERDPNPFMRVGGRFTDDTPSHDKHYLDLADLALGIKPPSPSRRKGKQSKPGSPPPAQP